MQNLLKYIYLIIAIIFVGIAALFYNLAQPFSKNESFYGEEGVDLRAKFNKEFPVTEDDLIKRETVSNSESGSPVMLSFVLKGVRYDKGTYYFKVGTPIEVRVAADLASGGQIKWFNDAYTTMKNQTLTKEINLKEFSNVGVFSGQYLLDEDTASLSVSVASNSGQTSWIIVKVQAEK